MESVQRHADRSWVADEVPRQAMNWEIRSRSPQDAEGTIGILSNFF